MKNDMTMKNVTMAELDDLFGGIKFKCFSIEKCPDCGYWEFMSGNKQLTKCPKCGSTKIRRVFGV